MGYFPPPGRDPEPVAVFCGAEPPFCPGVCFDVLGFMIFLEVEKREPLSITGAFRGGRELDLSS